VDQSGEISEQWDESTSKTGAVMNISTVSVGFLGAGRMATALARGFIEGGISAGHLTAVDPYAQARAEFEDSVGGGVVVQDEPNEQLFQADILILAVKPQTLPQALSCLVKRLRLEQLVVSIAAGISLSQLEGMLPDETRVIRVMPNTPCLVGAGASGISAGAHATADDLEMIGTLLKSVGIVETIPEKLMDAVTGLSGSGPAYVFQIIEALSDGGVRMGLPRATATRLAAQTLLGSARMVLETGEHPGQLKDAVTSPGGTTIAGIHALESGGLRATLMNAVQASATRSAELG
jgi:pyrroline-5-carboxylate reductase